MVLTAVKRLILVGFFLSLSRFAYASCASELMPIFTAAQAKELCESFGSAVNTNLIPKTDNTFDIGSSTLEWKDLYIDGTAYIDTLLPDSIGSDAAPAGVITFGNPTYIGLASYSAGNTSVVLGSKSNHEVEFRVNNSEEMILSNDQLYLPGSNFQLVPGSSTFTIRNNADSTNNYLFNNNGVFALQGASAQLEITGQAGSGIKLKSPDGTCSLCTVSNADAFSCTSIAC